MRAKKKTTIPRSDHGKPTAGASNTNQGDPLPPEAIQQDKSSTTDEQAATTIPGSEHGESTAGASSTNQGDSLPPEAMQQDESNTTDEQAATTILNSEHGESTAGASSTNQGDPLPPEAMQQDESNMTDEQAAMTIPRLDHGKPTASANSAIQGESLPAAVSTAGANSTTGNDPPSVGRRIVLSNASGARKNDNGKRRSTQNENSNKRVRDAIRGDPQDDEVTEIHVVNKDQEEDNGSSSSSPRETSPPGDPDGDSESEFEQDSDTNNSEDDEEVELVDEDESENKSIDEEDQEESDLLGNIIEDDIPNTFEVMEYIKDDQQATPLVSQADKNIQKIDLLPLSLFVHQTEKLLMCKYIRCKIYRLFFFLLFTYEFYCSSVRGKIFTILLRYSFSRFPITRSTLCKSQDRFVSKCQRYLSACSCRGQVNWKGFRRRDAFNNV